MRSQYEERLLAAFFSALGEPEMAKTLAEGTLLIMESSLSITQSHKMQVVIGVRILAGSVMNVILNTGTGLDLVCKATNCQISEIDVMQREQRPLRSAADTLHNVFGIIKRLIQLWQQATKNLFPCSR